MNIMEVKNIKKVYDLRNGSSKSNALNGINLKAEKGEFLGIMGPSGAGKSTLLNVISTIDTPTEGTIHVNGKNLLNLDEDELCMFRRKQLGFIFQDYNLLDTLTLKENIILPLTFAKESVDVIEDKVNKISKILNIEDILKKFPLAEGRGRLTGDKLFAEINGKKYYINSVSHNSNDTVVEISLKSNDKNIFIEIKDNGRGMTDEEVQRLFER